ncbi:MULTISPECIES: hypothetical protein [unclassified Streptomyces]|uniref:hypothetical protein n=1 Tax=unclassified Streptomyces TaxID=2593676 RepID=UPI0035DA4907
MKAPRVVAVSLQKCGTHLVKELMSALGYGLYGQLLVTDDVRPSFSEEAAWRMVEMVLTAEEVDHLKAAGDPQAFVTAAERAAQAIGWAWKRRLGLPLDNWYGHELPDPVLVERAYRATRGGDFSETPENICWILHQLKVGEADGRFLREWVATGHPRIVFNYRDPRDALISMVDYLAKGERIKYGLFAEFHVYSEILGSIPSMAGRLEYALGDPCFPGLRDFEDSMWLLAHPRVCNVSFEELVGEKGGGSRDVQLATVRRVQEFLGDDSDTQVTADALFNENAFTFNRGRSGGWQQHFTPSVEEKFDSRYGHLLSAYGYR